MTLFRQQQAEFLRPFSTTAAQDIPTPTFEITAPGRINLVGEHTDYNGGKVLPFALGLGVTIRCARAHTRSFAPFVKHGDGPWFLVTSRVSDDVFAVSWHELRAEYSSGEKLAPEIRKSWARYAAGCLALFAEHFSGTGSAQPKNAATAGRTGAPSPDDPDIEGRLAQLRETVFTFDVSSTLPRGAGLSSSAAFCTGMLSALAVQLGLPMDASTIARTAMLVEHRFAGTNCGLMDQLAVMCGRANHFTAIDFHDFPGAGAFGIGLVEAHSVFSHYSLVAINTNVSHALSDSAYNARRATCEKSLHLLNAHMRARGKIPAAEATPGSLGSYARPALFRSAFGKPSSDLPQAAVRAFLQREVFADQGGAADELAARAAHAIVENIRVDASVDALRSGNTAELHRNIRESHESLRADYEVSCVELDVACDAALQCAHELAAPLNLKIPAIIGPRMTGGGFGGSTIQWVHKAILAPFLEGFEAQDNPYTARTGRRPHLLVSQPENGLRISIL